eukprot:GILK01013606.1.p1 GENE.GILK01013606.1~~GILK01013606.1.p1  ORF type:complete len:575 (+),score=83.40 GILK01013606.1:102-1727(+)
MANRADKVIQNIVCAHHEEGKEIIQTSPLGSPEGSPRLVGDVTSQFKLVPASSPVRSPPSGDEAIKLISTLNQPLVMRPVGQEPLKHDMSAVLRQSGDATLEHSASAPILLPSEHEQKDHQKAELEKQEQEKRALELLERTYFCRKQGDPACNYFDLKPFIRKCVTQPTLPASVPTTVIEVAPLGKSGYQMTELESRYNNDISHTICFPSELKQIKVQIVLLLYNPFSGARKGEKHANKASKLLQERGIRVQEVPLREAGHCERLCFEMDLAAYDVLLVCGGDGTFHEAVNGLMRRSDEVGRRIPVSMIAAGTGNSFSLELQGNIDVKTSVDRVCRGLCCPIDVAELTFPHDNGVEEVVYSFNSIHWGLASKINVTAERLRWMGRAIRYTTAALMELIHGDKQRAKVIIETPDGVMREIDDEFCLIIANNIYSTMKGMKMFPHAKLNDGLIDLLLIKSSNTFDLMRVFMSLKDGSHTHLSYVDYYQVKRFAIIPFKAANPDAIATTDDADSAEEILDVDGELKGSTPFSCEVLNRALHVIV